MEVRDLPVVSRSRQLLLQPRTLFRIWIGAVEREEPDALLRRLEGVIQLAVHVEQLVIALPLALVVIPERGVELDAGLEHTLVRELELGLEILPPLRAIEVVADGDDQLEREALVGLGHLRPELVLFALAGPEVAEHGEFERALTIRELDSGSACRGRGLGLGGCLDGRGPGAGGRRQPE